MLSQAQRTTILQLHAQGVGKREIARVLMLAHAYLFSLFSLAARAAMDL